MNLEQLRSFIEIAHTGHFTRAAERLHLAQPSLSRQIATLERELNVELFHRARGHITLTAAGEALMPRAQRMLAEADAVKDDVAELLDLRRGRVRIGATPTLCVSLIAEVLTAFRTQHPGIDVQLTEGGSRLLQEQLAVGALDVALITTSEGPATPGVSLTRAPLLAEELVVIWASDQPAPTAEQEITLDELSRQPLIVFPESYDLRVATDAAFRSAGLSPAPVIEGVEMHTALRFVERGLGVALAPAMVLHDRPTLSSTRLAEPRLERTVSLAHRADVTPPRAAEAMQRAIVKTAGRLAERNPATRVLTDASRRGDGVRALR
ncbi:LysR family transcriptional regulator [Paramicrobacterium sp. CJ85]|uniref:LysR family transcriptional regulator n=1 Tax=Paramicrobacterium sp. CJ85 TaxID=3445355 RepID=UPI003F64146B